MANFTGTSIFNILTTQFVPSTGASPLDATHTFTAGGVNLGEVEVLNFYGDRTITSTTNVATTYFPDVTGAQDGIMCIRVFHGNLSITGNTFTPPHRTKGMFVLVKGNLTLGSGGVISMTGKGSNAAGQNVAIWQGATIPAGGGGGATSASVTATSTTSIGFGTGANRTNGNNGTAGTLRGSGGGGSGAVHGFVGSGGSGTFTFSSGAGSAGTSWSGGSGGGGIAAGRDTTTTWSAGNAIGSTGGSGYSARTTGTGAVRRAGGGAGITAGAGTFTSGSQLVGTGAESSSNNTGAGGLLMLACLGLVTFTNTTSKLLSRGAGDGGLSVTTAAEFLSAGGASGGGSINIVYRSANQTKEDIEGTNGLSSYADSRGGSGTSISSTVTNYAYGSTSGAGGSGSITANTFATEGVALPRRTLINAGGTYYYRDFSIALGQANDWRIANGTGTTPFEQFGMLDGEVYALDRAAIANITGIDLTAVRFEVYQP